jgi:hypothetical protein
MTSPIHAKQLLNALQQNVALYEKNFGPIRTDFEAAPALPTADPARPN